MKNSSTKTDKNNNQKEKFIAAARELGCDMTQEDFAKKLKGIGSVKPMTNEQVKKKAKKKK